MKTEYVIKTASASCPSSWKWQHPRRRVAVLEVESGTEPTMISERAQGVVRIVETWERLYVGKTARSEYGRALAEAEDLVATLEQERAA